MPCSAAGRPGQWRVGASGARPAVGRTPFGPTREMALKSIMKSALAGGWKSPCPMAQTHDSGPTEYASSNRPRALAPNDFDRSSKAAKGVGFTPRRPAHQKQKRPVAICARALMQSIEDCIE